MFLFYGVDMCFQRGRILSPLAFNYCRQVWFFSHISCVVNAASDFGGYGNLEHNHCVLFKTSTNMDLDLGLKVQIPLFAGGAAWMIMNILGILPQSQAEL
jgi:hypothetical protein